MKDLSKKPDETFKSDPIQKPSVDLSNNRFVITKEIIKAIAPTAPKDVEKFIPHLNNYMDKYEVNTFLRAAHFLAQLAHESGNFVYVKELWGPTPAQKKYEGRKDLGNIVAGDGSKFRGRGLIQITGRANYSAVSRVLFNKQEILTKNPEMLEMPEWAVASAVWFWNNRKLNAQADKDNVLGITSTINGGYNGLEDRKKKLAIAKKVLQPLFNV